MIPEEEDYPEAFSFEEFKSIRSFNGKLVYAAQHLKRLSSGSSRVVYEIDNEKVLKIAKNRKGLIQNESEAELYKFRYDVTAEVFASDDKYFWVEMEKAKRVTPASFRNFFGFTLKQLYDYLAYVNAQRQPISKNMSPPTIDPQFNEFMENYEFVQDLIRFIVDYDFPCPGDFDRASTWGEVTHNGVKRIVLVDFGFSRDAAKVYGF